MHATAVAFAKKGPSQSVDRKEDGVSGVPREKRAFHLSRARASPVAEQGARANDHGRHAACYRGSLEMKPWNVNRFAARGAPATVVAHL